MIQKPRNTINTAPNKVPIQVSEKYLPINAPIMLSGNVVLIEIRIKGAK